MNESQRHSKLEAFATSLAECRSHSAPLIEKILAARAEVRKYTEQDLDDGLPDYEYVSIKVPKVLIEELEREANAVSTSLQKLLEHWKELESAFADLSTRLDLAQKKQLLAEHNLTALSQRYRKSAESQLAAEEDLVRLHGELDHLIESLRSRASD